MTTLPDRRGLDGRVTLALLLIAATALRLINLAAYPFEQDELYTLRDARDLGATAGDAPGIAGRPLYYLLQHGLLEVLPPTPLLLRLPALVFGVLGIWLLYELARRRFGTGAGLAAVALAAVSPWHLYMSQFARYWTLVFALATATYLLLPRALDSDRPRDYAAALAVIVAGLLTHPTFAFALVGFVAALHLVGRDGEFRLRWPGRVAWLWLWGPLLLFATAAYLVLSLTGEEGSLRNWGGRGAEATLRLLPAMVQWAEPVFVTAGLLGMLWLAARGGPDRRWGATALTATAAGTALLLLAALRTDVYADYGTALLPLLFVSAAGLLQRLQERARLARGGVLVGGAVLLVVSMLPGTVSHLTDGTRYDYRSAFGRVAAADPGALVVGGPTILARHYGATLRTREMPDGPAALERWLAEEAGALWVITEHRRWGMASGGAALQRWVDSRCRTEARIGRTRLDFRLYRLEVHRCGAGNASAPPPSGAPPSGSAPSAAAEGGAAPAPAEMWPSS